MSDRSKRWHAVLSAIPPVVLFGGAALAFLLWGRHELHGIQREVVILVSAFALWRYGWQVLHFLRAGWYSAWHYPRLRAAAQQVAQERPWPKQVYVVVPSCQEEAWVSSHAMQALMGNLLALPCHCTVVVAAGSDDDEAVITAACQPWLVRGRIELVFQRQAQGKRIAMGQALRAVARRCQPEPDSVTVFMDGDSCLESGALSKVIPFFMACRDLGAVTTNEEACIPAGGAWYRDWFNFKFGQRQVLFQSHSLSHKVPTLTGRFSVFRTSIVVSEDFLKPMENDTIDDRPHGRLHLLMGDDKSSWLHVLREGWNMLYLPDVACVSLPSRAEPFLQASLSLPYRWFSNTLRDNSRALALGPRHTGWFIWLVLLDQRLSMWTSLAGITGAGVLAATKSFIYLPLYVAWAVAVRSLQLLVIAWHGHAVSLRTIPIMLYTQWVGALVKIKAWHQLADPNWSKGKASQQAQAAPAGPWRKLVPTGRMLVAYLVFALGILLTHSALRLPGTELFAAQTSAAPATAPVAVEVAVAGELRADDGRDDAAALQAILDRQPPGPLLLRLPPGQLDFQQPLVIRRDGVTLQGAGRDRTRIVSHLRVPESAVIRVEGEPGQRAGLLTEVLQADGKLLRTNADLRPEPGTLLWLRQANDDAFLRAIGSERWSREHPHLRQALLEVAGGERGLVRLQHAPGIAFDGGRTDVIRVRPVRSVTLSDFTLEQRAGTRGIASVRHVYENAVPENAVDGIALLWTQDVVIERVAIRAAGRHPISIEQSHGFSVRDCLVDGAWNKGEGGNGYLRIARSYHGTVEGCQVRGIRHITLQWSSAFNRIRNVDSDVDVNFHGGYSHHNQVEDVRFAIPARHPWRDITTTPRDAQWAPPDGPGNLVGGREPGKALVARAASPAR